MWEEMVWGIEKRECYLRVNMIDRKLRYIVFEMSVWLCFDEICKILDDKLGELW